MYAPQSLVLSPLVKQLTRVAINITLKNKAATLWATTLY